MDKINYDEYYHIYNRGINGCNIFSNDNDFNKFLQLYKKYIPHIADTFAWCLMGNHLHLLVRIKSKDEIGFFVSKKVGHKFDWAIKLPDEINKIEMSQKLKQPTTSKQFSHLFNAYAKYFNLKNNRTGSLFEKSFKRKCVDSDEYFKYLVYYVHHNPVHHGFTKNLGEYKWTSYNDYIFENDSFLIKKEVIEQFDNIDNFIYFHNEEHNLSLIDDYVLE